ncbi:hypothetical protein HCN44_001603 [Aphidius gifuensis]|uniref:Peptidase S1 domain-containing protein n=1 Tax=Aphidius gifuensis TaxID=684658 RepID=A0A834XRU2_APHGI|nr:hypothetical protein HCN44_001603 [Aphidius gifuensis]
MNKIIGGRTAYIDEFPHQVSVLYREHHMCGGSILTNNYVLTSATCIMYDLVVVTANLRIFTGTNDRLQRDFTGQYHNVALIIYNPLYSPRLFWHNDLAILKLETPIIYTRYCKNIELPFKIIRPCMKLDTCGWAHESSMTTRYLQKIEMKVLSQSNCYDYLISFTALNPIPVHTQACAKTEHQTISATLGDGGSGMVSNKFKTIVGVISIMFVNKADTIVFTDVHFYKDWIRNTISQ